MDPKSRSISIVNSESRESLFTVEKSSIPEHEHTKAPSVLKVLEGWCIWEYFGLLASGAIFIAIVAILREYNMKQQPDWQYVSLNSIISWMSTFAKASMMFSLSQGLGQLKWEWFSQKRRPLSDLMSFDSASRGVMGSIELLWMSRGRHFIVFGGLALILSIGVEPFIQNLVRYVPNSVEDLSQVCKLGQASGYNSLGPLINTDNYYVDPVLKANVYNALFNSDPTHSWAIPQYTCPTGNCTWDPVATLGIRTVCSNISSQLKTTCSYNTTTLTENCTVALNSLSVYYETYTPGVEMTDFGYLMAVGTDMDSAGAPTITYILASGTNNSPEMGGDEILNVSNNTQWIATECSLEPAVLSFQASVTEGVYSEIQLAEWTNSTDDNTSDNYTYFYVAMNPPWNQSLGMHQNQSFGIGVDAWLTINSFISGLFNGYVQAQQSQSMAFECGDFEVYACTDTLQALFFANFSSATTTASNPNDYCQKYNDSLSCLISNMAAAMTKTFRDSAFTNSSSEMTVSVLANTAIGHTMTTVPFVKIHWEWLALPVVVWVLCSLTLLGAAWKTRSARIQTWWNNPLPLLFLYRGNRSSGYAMGSIGENGETDAPSGVNRTHTSDYGVSNSAYVERVKKIHVKLNISRNDAMLIE